jgi:uncharacterized membrane protein
MNTVQALPTELPLASASARQVVTHGSLTSIDRLRGLVMMVMALDHVRDYFTSVKFDPLDLTQTNAALFLTRWITHYCAPTFILLAGTSAYLMSRRRTPASLSRFLLARGLWLIVLEFTVVEFAWTFNFAYDLGLIMQVIWAIGVSMVVLAGLVRLPRPAIAAFALVMIAAHNLLDGITPAQFGGAAWLWYVLHEQMPGPNGYIIVLYPLIPWIGVMAAGFVLGSIFDRRDARQRRLVIYGCALLAGFVVMRGINAYGDPAPWSAQPSTAFTVLSFINTTKYPPSLAYLLMTTGVGLLALAACEKLGGQVAGVLEIYGRVPLLFYVAHIMLAHLLAGLIGVATGFGTVILTNAFLFYPPQWGFGLPGVYAAWVAVLVIVYPACRWFADLKQRRREPWLSYL